MSKYSFSPSARAIRQRNNPPGSALMCSRLSLRKGYSGETSSESFSKSSLLRIITFVTSKTPGTQLAFFLRRLSSVLAFAANAAYCFSFSLLHLTFFEISLCSSRKKGGLGFSPEAFGYPNAMLALPGTVWDKKKDDTLWGIVFPWLRTHFIYRFNSL